jgi:hypothetical protein
MTWQITDRRGRKIAAGTLEQMYANLKLLLPDGEYRLVGPKLTVAVRRFRGKVHPFDEWEGWGPAAGVNRYRLPQ